MTAADIDQTIRDTIHATWRVVQPRLIATLSRMLRDVPLAEELTQDALVAALEAWPGIGVPDNPGAWLMTTARRRALDHLRRGRMLGEKHDMLARDMLQEQEAVPDFDAALRNMAGAEVNARWQKEMAAFFEGVPGKNADEQMAPIPEVFHLD